MSLCQPVSPEILPGWLPSKKTSMRLRRLSVYIITVCLDPQFNSPVLHDFCTVVFIALPLLTYKLRSIDQAIDYRR